MAEAAVAGPATAPATATTGPDTGETDEYGSLEKRIEELTRLRPKTTTVEAVAFSTSRGPGKLQKLERKVFECNALRVQMNKRDATISDLFIILEEARDVMAKHGEESARLRLRLKASTNELAGVIAELKDEAAALRKTLDLLRLGTYEFYEVKKDDTCKSIAADTAVYGDASKEQYIRQANVGNVADLDNLVPGQMMIIPRFPASGRYEF